MEIIKMTVAIPADLRKELKIQAAREGRPLASVVADALDAYLKKHKPPSG